MSRGHFYIGWVKIESIQNQRRIPLDERNEGTFLEVYVAT
jgi:hypothetical protein